MSKDNVIDLKKPESLIDDPITKTGAELIFEVISRAYEHHSLMVTSNLPFEQWTEVFGSERLAGALLDKITHRCHILWRPTAKATGYAKPKNDPNAGWNRN